jgi:hypothetical protein
VKRTVHWKQFCVSFFVVIKYVCAINIINPDVLLTRTKRNVACAMPSRRTRSNRNVDIGSAVGSVQVVAAPPSVFASEDDVSARFVANAKEYTRFVDDALLLSEEEEVVEECRGEGS